MSHTETLPGWLRAGIDALIAGNVEGWLDMYAEDAVQEFPWAPADRPHRLEGRSAIAAFMTDAVAKSLFAFGPLTNVRAHDLGDTLIVEAEGHPTKKIGHGSIHLGYIWLITRRDDKVRWWREYTHLLTA